MNLEQTATSLLEQFPTADRANLQKQERMLESFGRIAFGGFGVVIATAVLAIIYLIITKLVLTGANFWGGILLVAFILFAGLTLAYVMLNETLQEKRAKLNPQASPAPGLETPATGRLLPEVEFEPAASVVENTTELLTPNRRSTTREL